MKRQRSLTSTQSLDALIDEAEILIQKEQELPLERRIVSITDLLMDRETDVTVAQLHSILNLKMGVHATVLLLFGLRSALFSDQELDAALLSHVLSLLDSVHPLIRCESLLLCSSRASFAWCTDHSLFEVATSILASDVDARVRAAALQSILLMSDRGFTAPYLTLFPVVLQSVQQDESAQVQLLGAKCLWQFAMTQDQECRDTVFIELCSLAMDAIHMVRCQACALLGTIPNVTPLLLLQALSKDTRVETQKKHEKGVGAFVHALEEEYMLIRCAALESICAQGLSCQEFGAAAFDSVVDMFNDDIEVVRLTAIHTLRKMCKYQMLTEEQVKTILFLLSETSAEVRSAVKQLLTDLVLPDVNCVRHACTGLLGNLQAYPEDKQQIFDTLRAIGTNHPCICELLLDDLLESDSRYITQQKSISDIFYVAKLHMLQSASFVSPRLLVLMPPFVQQQLLYLRSEPVPKSEQETEARLVKILQTLSLLCERATDGISDQLQGLAEDAALVRAEAPVALVDTAVFALDYVKLAQCHFVFVGCVDFSMRSAVRNQRTKLALSILQRYSGLSEEVTTQLNELVMGSLKFFAPEWNPEVRRLEAEITVKCSQPQFFSSFPFNLNISGTLSNTAQAGHRFGFLVVTPDQKCRYIDLDSFKLAPVADKDESLHFTSKVTLISHLTGWSETCQVHVMLVKRFNSQETPPAVIGMDQFVIQWTHAFSALVLCSASVPLRVIR